VTIELVPFEQKHLHLVEHWFDHGEVRRRLGGRDWPARELALVSKTPGSQYRGALVWARHNWVGFDDDSAIGLIGGETYDRWTRYEGEGAEGPIISESIDLPAMGLHYVVDPVSWGRGYCGELLQEVFARPEVAQMRVFDAGVEPDNVASIRCLARSGFVKLSPEPDWQGILHLLRTR
jgi:RimJ/RimL family protein N-acetyltransferase